MERTKEKAKKPKIRELSPPPSVLSLKELDELYAGTDEQPCVGASTSIQDNTSTISRQDVAEECSSDNQRATAKSAKKSEDESTTGQQFASDQTETARMKIRDESEKNTTVSGAVNANEKNEIGMPDLVPSVPVESIYPCSTNFTSPFHMDDLGQEAVIDERQQILNIYPDIELNGSKTSVISPTTIREMPAVATKERIDVMDTTVASIYPSLSLERNEYGLLTENQLLDFYQNILYETAEDFVDEFLKHEENPAHNLLEYLSRYKGVCEQIDANEIDTSDCEELIRQCVAASWTTENRIIKQEGRCGDQKYATGSATYMVATYHPETVLELKRLLKRDVTLRLDSSLSFHIQLRSLALQIQWFVISYNDAFMTEHRLNKNSPQCLLPSGADTISRRNLRNALSDLFHSLRYPNLPSRFISSVSGWISELVAVLLKACTPDDQQYLLCQVLRLISPTSQWAAPLLQSFIEIDSVNDRLIIDNCIAMLSILLAPIRGRENFLLRVIDFENSENNTWIIINDDGVENNKSLVTVNETDLIAFFNQFSSEALLAKAIRHFAITLRSSSIDQALTMIAFELVLIKIFSDGLHTYATADYRQFCKQIGNALRQSVKCLGEFIKVIKEMLSNDEMGTVQKEFDRIILQAVYYIVSKKSLGLWQFLVDLPYDIASSSCRMRCEILLRRRITITLTELYEIPDRDLPLLTRTAGNLLDKLPDLPSDDRIYMISTLAAVIASDDKNIDAFAVEIMNVCFLDVSTRDHFYKVGSETFGILIDKHPYILQKILLLIDRNIDALEEYAVEVLSTAPLSKCRLSEDDVGVICGKWLINRPPNHPASRIARRVLGSMNWGTDIDGNLWLPREVHVICADTIMKGHMAQCKATNGLISKSWNKIIKLASKVPDYEHRFDAFCWDILVRLKLPIKDKNINFQSINDLASFFLFITQRSLLSVDEFLSSGVSLWSELITAGCYAASVVILMRLVASFPDSINSFISQPSFTLCLDRLLLLDQSSYVIQAVSSDDKFPGSTVRLLASAITYQLSENFTQEQLNGWMQLLCCKRPTQWNTNKCTLYLLGNIVRIAFAKDPKHLLGLPEFLKTSYALILQQWKDGSKGMLSWFTSDDNVPALIDTVNLNISPWASYALLLTEQQSHNAFYEALYQTMNRHPKNSLCQSVKKAATKSHVTLSVEQLHFHRWLQLALVNGIIKHPIFPLILQNLAVHLYSRHTYLAGKVCYGLKYLTNSSSQPLYEELRKTVLPLAKHDSEKNIALFYEAVNQWLSDPRICNVQFNSYNDLLLNHLLQFIIAGDLHPWVEYVDMNKLRDKINDGRKLYIFACHIGSFVIPPAAPVSVRNLSVMVAHFSKQNQAKPGPTVPLHPTLPREVPFTFASACDSRFCLTPFALQIKEINEAARTFVSAKDRIELLDLKYIDSYPKLYTKLPLELSITLKCGTTFGAKCTHPTSSVVTVRSSKYERTVEYKMKGNRQNRSTELANIFSQLFDRTSLHCAHFETMASKMYEFSQNIDILGTEHAKEINNSGRVLFYHLTSSVTALEMILPAAADSYAFVLTKLGKAFIANNPKEQGNLMRVVLNHSHLSHLLTPHFTPHCVPSDELLNLYESLSQAVRNPLLSSAALTLLSQLDIKNAGDRLPPQQFAQFMPAAFKNLISVLDISSPLFAICERHFIHSVFHRFPSNFIDGLKLILEGCDTKSTPVCIFDKIIEQIGATKMDAVAINPEYIVDAVTANMGNAAIAMQLKISRNKLSTKLYEVWDSYLSKVLILAGFFQYKAASLSFDSQRPVTKLESALRQLFDDSVQVFGPLLEPFGAGYAPWNPADAKNAAIVLKNFVDLMEQFHLLYDAYLPPGSENLITLFWRYYAEKLAILTPGGSHVHQIIENHFINVSWHFFWPSLYDLAAMDKILIEGARESAPLLTQIFVRIPWLPLIQYQAQQPLDAHRAFYSLLFSILTSCVSQPANYSICRASMPKLINTMGSFPWHLIEIEQLRTVSFHMASNFSPLFLSDPNDVTYAFFELYRRVCFIGINSVNNVQDTELCQRQSVYVRTQLTLMLRNSDDRTWLCRFYEDQIGAVHTIISSAKQSPTQNQTFLSQELTSFWSDISDHKFLETFTSTLSDWLKKNAASPIVLLLMNTTVRTLKTNQVLIGLRLIEKCIEAYFSRTDLCEWNVVLKWIILPDDCSKNLFTPPSSELLLPFLPLCANAFIIKGIISSTSVDQETALLRNLLNFIITIKPRYVTNEAAFVLLMEKLQKLLLRQYNHSIVQGNQFLMQYLEWLVCVHSDDKSSSFFSIIGLSRKQSYPLKIRYICHLMELYITQQTLSPDRPPRSASNSPVLNSRIQAFRDLSAQKQYAPFQTTSTMAQPYFIQVENYHIIHMKELFAHIVRSLYNEKYIGDILANAGASY